MNLTDTQKLKYIDLHVGRDGAWITLTSKAGKSFSFQPIQEFGPATHWRKYVLEWSEDLQNEINKEVV